MRDADQRLWIRRYHETEFTRIGLREILGLATFEQNLLELTALAEACLQYALEVALRQHRLKTCPVAIIGLGKLGGAELNYGSDLDVLFVADDKARNLPNLQRIAVTVMDLIGGQTERGTAFELDARLRPDGEKGLLVNHLRAYLDYYRQRAQLWELQALSRCRPVAGHPELGRRFVEGVASLTDFSRSDCPAAAYTPGWKAEIARMRRRIEKERTTAGKDPLAIKTGRGGLVDAEFIAQAFNLERGWHEANTLQALERARSEGLLAAADAASLITNYRHLRRIEGILRRWSYEGETELPDDPAPQYRVAVRCGFATIEDFLAAVNRYRSNIRAVYEKVFPAAPPEATSGTLPVRSSTSGSAKNHVNSASQLMRYVMGKSSKTPPAPTEQFCKSEIERMLRVSQTKVLIMPVLALGLLRVYIEKQGACLLGRRHPQGVRGCGQET